MNILSKLRIGVILFVVGIEAFLNEVASGAPHELLSDFRGDLQNANEIMKFIETRMYRFLFPGFHTGWIYFLNGAEPNLPALLDHLIDRVSIAYSLAESGFT